MITDEQRSAEAAKYVRAYSVPKYHMGAPRMKDAVADLKALPCRGGYLDVSCGRREMLDAARYLGFHPVKGTEYIPELVDGDEVEFAAAHALPFEDDAFDVVSMFDVIEHLHIGDDRAACLELARVARRHVLLTANNKLSFSKAGDTLHINRRNYSAWNALLKEWFAPAKVTWISNGVPRAYVSQCWRVDL